jgi:hypothetical protein
VNSSTANIEGFFWCSRCKKVVELPPADIEAALSAPIGVLRDLKCPGCKHHAVRWKVPMVERPRTNDGRIIKPLPTPVDPERGRELFAKLKMMIL